MGKILGLHPLELRPEVDAQAFEQFVARDLAPLYRRVAGQDAYLIKGDRGAHVGQYVMVIELASPSVRDQIYPETDSFSPEFEQALVGTDAVWERLETFVSIGVSGPDWTDYVVIDA